jgi:regulatory LuxR family protein
MKPLRDAVLVSAIRDAIDRSRTALEREAEMQALRDCYASLTGREREVMARVAAGRLNKQVAAELGISEITGEGAPRARDAKDARRFGGRPGEDGRDTATHPARSSAAAAVRREQYHRAIASAPPSRESCTG